MPESITQAMRGMVSEVSATLVEDQAALVSRMEHALLVAEAEPREQRQHFRFAVPPALQHLGAFADLALTGQEHEHVAARIDLRERFHRARHMLRQFLVIRRRQEKLRHRKHPSRSLDHRRGFAVHDGGEAA